MKHRWGIDFVNHVIGTMRTEPYKAIDAYFTRELPDLEPRGGMIIDILDAIPENWVKVGDEWHEIPIEHFISVETNRGGYGDDEPMCDWRMEHSLPCRIAGMEHCEIQEVWEAHLEEDGHWPKNGRYRIWIEGENAPREDVFEDTRVVEWEAVE